MLDGYGREWQQPIEIIKKIKLETVPYEVAYEENQRTENSPVINVEIEYRDGYLETYSMYCKYYIYFAVLEEGQKKTYKIPYGRTKEIVFYD